MKMLDKALLNDAEKTLFEACEVGNLEEVKKILNEGVNLEARNIEGYTALMAAIHGGQAEAARLLIENGADVNARKGNGDSVLIFAISKGQYEVARALIENGTDIHAKNYLDETALIKAAQTHAPAELIKLLLEKGADVRSVDLHVKSALSYASEQGNKELKELLLFR